ncbi:MAG: potassium-transporting ATPase subunit F [Deltaproteobacteria bacterium]|nr:potassium-transporting ATPase subunit F [Deltaproteobacteria bacterium]
MSIGCQRTPVEVAIYALLTLVVVVVIYLFYAVINPEKF